jgi:hypothetical protein
VGIEAVEGLHEDRVARPRAVAAGARGIQKRKAEKAEAIPDGGFGRIGFQPEKIAPTVRGAGLDPVDGRQNPGVEAWGRVAVELAVTLMMG